MTAQTNNIQFAYMLLVRPDTWGNSGHVYLIKADGDAKDVNFKIFDLKMRNDGRISQKDFEEMEGKYFRIPDFAPEHITTPPKKNVAMDAHMVIAYKLEGENADETVLWKTFDTGQIEVLKKIKKAAEDAD